MPPRTIPAHLQRLSSPSRCLRPTIIRHVSRLRPLEPPFPTTAKCPPPSCPCAPTPSFPPGSEIDKTTPLNGVMTSYAEQVLVCTGREDWASRIEDEEGGMAGALKGIFGRGGTYADPFHNVSVLNSSFESSEGAGSSAYILPSFKYIPNLSRRPEMLEALAKGYILPSKLHPAHDGMTPAHRRRLTRDEGYREILPAEDVRDVLVLICGHGGRDIRCGTMGRVLRDEFEAALGRAGLELATRQTEGGDSSNRRTARVGLVSHIGGHKFAGNVIIYIPPGFGDGERHALDGCGIWYGRIEPRQVEGLVEETIVKGRVVADHFRGGIDSHRKILRM